MTIPADMREASEVARELLTLWTEVSSRGFPEVSGRMLGTMKRVNEAGVVQVLMCLSSLATTAIQLLGDASSEPEKLVLQRLFLAEAVTLEKQLGTSD